MGVKTNTLYPVLQFMDIEKGIVSLWRKKHMSYLF